MVGLALASGVTGALGARALDDDDDDGGSAGSTSPVVNSDSNGAEAEDQTSQAAAAVLPSVVSISSESQMGEGQGSGVVYNPDGYILTNNHVVASAGDGGDLQVTLANGNKVEAEVVGTDPASDLAVIKIKDMDKAGELTPATFGSSSDLVVGQEVLAVGSPLGLDGSVSSGIISAKNRPVTLPAASSPFEQQSQSSGTVVDAVQTDAAINPGNSGGPLVNTKGEVIGINTAIASLGGSGIGSSESGSIGVGFAIPSDEAVSVADQLIEDGEATHAYVGVRLADARSNSDSAPAGPVIAGVESGSPAAEAGLQEGDVVTKIDDKAVSDAAALTAAIRSHQPGDEVKLTIDRDGEESTVSVKLGTLPTSSS